MERFLTQNDINAFNAYAEYSSNITPYKDYLRDKWLPGNLEIIEGLFGGKTLLEREIETAMSPELLERQFETFINKHQKFKDLMWRYLYGKDSIFSIDNEDFSNCSFYWSLFSQDSIVDNTFYPYVRSCIYINLVHKPTQKKMRIQLNQTKISKIFNFILKYLQDDELNALYEAFRIDQSKLIQQKSFKGTMCLSVHPLDFATMSDNRENWNSCMSWMNDGCYRAGTLEMMASPIVLVGYIKSKTSELEFNGYTWNSKIWRSLFIVNENIITEVKSYPFYSAALSKIAIEWLAELSGPAFSEAPLLEVSDNYGENLDCVHGLIFGNADIITPEFRFVTYRMYNDIGYQSHYYGIISKEFLLEPHEYSYYIIEYGTDAYCLECGLPIEGSSNGLLCDECGEYIKCEHCGRIIDFNREEVYCGPDGEEYCESCWEELATGLCHWCGRSYIAEDDNEYKIYCKLPNGDTITTIICDHCYRNFCRNKRIDKKDFVETTKITKTDFICLFEDPLNEKYTEDEQSSLLDSMKFDNFEY